MSLAIAAVLLLLAGSGFLAWQRFAGDERSSNTTTVNAADDGRHDASDPSAEAATHPAGAAPATRDAARTRPTAAWALQAGEPLQPIVLFALQGEAGPPLLFLPWEWFPLQGGFADSTGAPVELMVLAARPELGFALLSPKGPLPATVRPLVPAAAAFPGKARALVPGGTETGEVTVTEPLAPAGRWRVDPALAAGTVLVDAEGRAVAAALGDEEVVALQAVLPWLGRSGAQPLAAAQRQLRATDPSLLLQEANELLGRDPPTLAIARQALGLLEQGQPLVRQREQAEVYDEHLRVAHRLIVRLLAQDDRRQALAHATAALARFPGDVPLLADAVRFALDAPAEAARFYVALQRAAPAAAADVAEELATAFLTAGARQLQQRRHAEAIDTLRSAVALFPTHGQLRLRLAQALLAARQPDAAAAEAAEAARADPRLAAEAAEVQAAAERGRGPSTVEVPFDPATNAIHAAADVGGQGLQFVVDTGATYTTIPTGVASRLRLPTLRTVQVTTASGVVVAPLVELPSLRIGELRLGKVRAVALDLPGTLAGKGLLGMNVLQQLNMQIDTQNRRLLLHPPRHRGR